MRIMAENVVAKLVHPATDEQHGALELWNFKYSDKLLRVYKYKLLYIH